MLGSSPLTRGKPRRLNARDEGVRLIPAHAGKTRRDLPAHNVCTAHPRSRGENRRGIRNYPRGCGSSPLTRGKPLARPRDLPPRRLIPAHAGKTNQSGQPLAQHRAHPRSRGENGLDRRKRPRRIGSSPLTRGKHGLAVGHVLERRLIPAHAGKTSTMRPDARAEGSSPLTRGKLPVNCGLNRVQRLIPAHAGKTFSPLLTRW